MLNSYSKEMFFDKANNRLVFRILSKDSENYEKTAKIRFETAVEEQYFVHEFTHYLDSLRYSKSYIFKHPKNLLLYYNSPEEMNAIYHEMLNNILKLKSKLKKYKQNEFIDYVINNIAPEDWINALTKENLQKVNTRLYKLYDRLYKNNI